MVFPARAGMSPPHPDDTTRDSRFPRPRGDEPLEKLVGKADLPFSPPARG